MVFGDVHPSRSVFTIHNMEFGVDQIGRAVAAANVSTTVSPTYAMEVPPPPMLNIGCILVCFKYYTLNLMPLMVYPKVLVRVDIHRNIQCLTSGAASLPAWQPSRGVTQQDSVHSNVAAEIVLRRGKRGTEEQDSRTVASSWKGLETGQPFCHGCKDLVAC